MPRPYLMITHVDPDRPHHVRWSRENRLYVVIAPSRIESGKRERLAGWCARKGYDYTRVWHVVRYWPYGVYTTEFSLLTDWVRTTADPDAPEWRKRLLTRNLTALRKRLGGIS